MAPETLYYKLQNGEEIILLDVREPYEYQICKLKKSLHIPINQIVSKINKLPKDKEMVVLCHHGVRSIMVVNYLKKQGFEKVHNLDGGINLWAIKVDPRLTRY